MVQTSLSLGEINALDEAAFVAVFGGLFEHSPWIARATWPTRPFSSGRDLLEKLVATLRAAPRDAQLTLIRAHPDLAGRLAKEGALTQSSTAEQASAGLDRLSAEEAARFGTYNDLYRERFGFPFIICARLNNKREILRAFERRLQSTPEEETMTALCEIEKIASLRLAAILPEEKT